MPHIKVWVVFFHHMIVHHVIGKDLSKIILTNFEGTSQACALSCHGSELCINGVHVYDVECESTKSLV